ncbi:acyl-CoA dehydrogenase family protein [Glaciimonas sp. PCH181]|uniref:acyl-CoA dehydrogenase family protein n=1 Tax=Glaciimonas sp. PCH181 TaxID=2133943 RepID=UPI001375256C|nr:acyl-CoA dehydrogenase family protein [Glaciimonas sp. PCH181]
MTTLNKHAAEVLHPHQLLAASHEIGIWLATEAAQWDLAGEPNLAAFDRIRTLRLGAMRVPRSLGGAGGRIRDVTAMIIALARGDSSVAQALLPHFVFVERTLLMATPAQAADLLAQVASGALVGGASAERGGKFRGEVRTLLAASEGGYRLNGIKQYSTGALIGDLIKVLAVDEAGDSVLAVLPVGRAGIVRHNDWNGLGQRGTVSGTTELQNVYVEEHEVMRVARWQTERHHTGAASQIIHSAIEVGIALAALEDAASWARRGVRPVKESGVQRAQDDPYILQTLGQISAQAHAAEAFVLHAAERIDAAADARYGAGDPAIVEKLAIDASIITAEAKAISTEAALFAGQALFDVGGASTTLRSHNFDRHWRNARTHTTHDPVAYKYRVIGDYNLNGEPPPISYGY